MLFNHYFHSHSKILKRPSITATLAPVGPESSADGSNKLNISVTMVKCGVFTVSLLTVQNDGSSTTASTFDNYMLVKALKNPKQKLAKVLREEESPRLIYDSKNDCNTYDMQLEDVQQFFFECILQVIFWCIENKNISIIFKHKPKFTNNIFKSVSNLKQVNCCLNESIIRI